MVVGMSLVAQNTYFHASFWGYIKIFNNFPYLLQKYRKFPILYLRALKSSHIAS